MVLVRRREGQGTVERFRRREAGEGHDLVRPGPGLRGGVGIFFTGGNRAAEAEDVEDSQEKFALFGETGLISWER